MEALYDPIRNRSVAKTPEEAVRQGVLKRMLEDLGYPKGFLAVEIEIGSARRRADIVCYTKNSVGSLVPLLIVECKAEQAGSEAREQAFGYNAAIGAPFIAIADRISIHTFWFDGCKIASVPFLPFYKDLQKLTKK